MRKFLQIAAVGAALLLVSLILAPILVYKLGVPWLPSQPQASNSQLALIYVIDAPLISGAGWLLITICKYLPHRLNSGSGLTTPKLQPTHLSQSQALGAAHNNQVVIGNLQQCHLEIGSEGIAYSCYGRLFIPWNEMIGVYLGGYHSQYGNHPVSCLCVALKTNSRLHFLERIKLSYDNGMIIICETPDHPTATIPKYLVQKALEIYKPQGLPLHFP